MIIPFYKMHGCGNDFVFIDNRTMDIKPQAMPDLTKTMCQKGFGIHADGVVFLNDAPSSQAHELAYMWHFFNSDGSVGEMCGNAARCAAWLSHAIGMAPAEHRFGTVAGTIQAKVVTAGAYDGEVQVQLTRPKDIRLNMELDLDGTPLTVHHVVVGVPHVVVVVEDLAAVDLMSIAPRLRHHDAFAPQGANVNIVQVANRNALYIRTYERGVEDETFACGTGAASAQKIAHLLGLTDNPSTVKTVTGLELKIDISGEEIFLQGPAVLSFRGEFYHMPDNGVLR